MRRGASFWRGAFAIINIRIRPPNGQTDAATLRPEGKRHMITLDLQRFAEDQGQSASISGDVTGGGTQEGQGQTQMTPFQQMIQGEGKAEFEQAVGQRVQQAISQRFRNQRDWQGQINGMKPIVDWAAKRFGVDPNDYKGIYAKATDDLSQYQEEADRQGMTPEAVRTMHRLREENAQIKAQQKQSQEEQQLEAHWKGLTQQAEELKQTFPNFDLMRELDNPAFMRMTSPGVGMSVKDAFWACHHDEIQKATMQYTAQQAGQRIAASVRAGASRPAENGMGRQNAAPMALDIRNMDPKTRQKYRERIANGETIDFSTRY